jgi:heme/copper-type cytochrome/quinol oxidase subunit 1
VRPVIAAIRASRSIRFPFGMAALSTAQFSARTVARFFGLAFETLKHGDKDRRKQPVGVGADTLEWTLSSPPPAHTFEILPTQDQWDHAPKHSFCANRKQIQQAGASASACCVILRIH